MSENTDQLSDAITELVPPLLHSLEGLMFIGRHLHPPRLEEVIKHVGALDKGVQDALVAFNAADWPEDFHPFRDRLVTTSTCVIRAYDELRASLEDAENGIMSAYRALRHSSRAFEALYPVAAVLPPVSRFFLEDEQRDDGALLQALAEERSDGASVGVHHFGNEKKERGGFSLYVPENYDPSKTYPVMVAMHGGSGHGRDFLWSWIRAARSRGVILLSPSSSDATWSLMGDDVDSPNLERMLAHVAENWSIDTDKLLLTGMSDGGTFTYVQGLQTDSKFTHLAPVSASFHPFLLEVVEGERLNGLPIYLTHGAKDWMFPIDIARTAHRALGGGGADIVYREIGDLSHTYPREENARILDWFLGGKRPEETEVS